MDTSAVDKLSARIEEAKNLEALEASRVALLGKKGALSAMMAQLRALPAEQRAQHGKTINQLKTSIEARLKERHDTLAHAHQRQALEAERQDLSLPARRVEWGSLHPLMQTIEEVIAIFGDMGFTVAEGPDIEDDFHNFAALNFPPDHPAREMQDSFYLQPRGDEADDLLLRTHTSPVQVRTMRAHEPPHRVLAPGRTYRADSDRTHSPMFHQAEGLCIDRDIHFGHLKGCLRDFCHAFFETDSVKLRFRASFFPFTEPSAEVDIACIKHKDRIEFGKGDDWLEILGSGMVHPYVLKACGVDSERWQGFAFGVGIERLAMLKYAIADLREFYNSDVRWLDHYSFPPWETPSLLRGLVCPA